MDTLTIRGKTLLIGFISLLLGILAVVLFFDQEIGLNYSVFVMIAISSGILLAHVFSRQLSLAHYELIGSGAFFSAMVFFRASELLTFFNVLGSVLIFLLTISTLTGKPLRNFLSHEYLKICFLPFRFILPFFETLSSFISLDKKGATNPRTKEIVRGILIAVPLLLVFGALFSSADRGFETLISNIFTITIDEVTLGKIIFGMLVSAFFIGAFGFIFTKVHAKEAPPANVLSRKVGITETMIVFGSINALFFVFILVQATYLFGGVAHLAEIGLTYAQYAREGFSQLVLVAVLSYLVITFAESKIVQEEGSHLRAFQILSGILILQVLIILVSAFSRLSLYEHAYGFSTIRLYSYAFMVWLATALSLLAHHIWKNGRREDFTFHTFCTVILLLFIMNILNPDALIAQRNLDRYRETGSIDAGYLGSLSIDALPYTVKLLDDPNKDVRDSFARALNSKNHRCDDTGICREEVRTATWQSLRFQTMTAEKSLRLKQDILRGSRI